MGQRLQSEEIVVEGGAHCLSTSRLRRSYLWPSKLRGENDRLCIGCEGVLHIWSTHVYWDSAHTIGSP